MNDRNSCGVLFAVVCFGLAVSGCKTHGKPLFEPEAASLAQQKMCDEQAGKKFHEDKHSDYDSYTSHYDPAENVCYLCVHSVDSDSSAVTSSDVVFDAFGGRIYAVYGWTSNPQSKKVSDGV